MDTIKPVSLLVPSLKDLEDPIGDEDLPESFPVDHFKCYSVEVTKGTPRFRLRKVTVTDQFNEPNGKEFIVIKPVRLCNPAEKRVGDEITGIQNSENHQMCYAVYPMWGEPRHQTVKGIHVNNQFGALKLDAKSERELCVPSTKTLPE